MRFKKILLVFPKIKSLLGPLRPPSGLGYIGQYIEEKGLEYEVIDLSSGDTFRDLKNTLRDFKPDLVGLSVMSPYYRQAFLVIEYIKRIRPNVCIAVGGHHLSATKVDMLRQCPFIDFGIMHEGEKTFFELCGNRDMAEIPGLIYRKNSHILRTEDRDFTSNLEEFPYPLYKKFKLNRYYSGSMGIITSRGCPYKCTFCTVATNNKNTYRLRNISSIIKEIEHWYRQGYRQFSINDDTFAIDRKRIIDLCDSIKGMSFKGLEINCGNGLRVDAIDKETLVKMRQTGFKHVVFGVESANDDILRVMKKQITFRKVQEAIEDGLDAGLEIKLFFSIGHINETPGHAEYSLQFAKTYPVVDALFHFLVPFPDTELFDYVLKNNYFLRRPEVYLNDSRVWANKMFPIYETPYFSYREKKKIFKRVCKIRKEIRRKWMLGKLEKLGPLKGLISYLCSRACIYNFFMYSRLRESMKKLFYAVVS
ncbi:MAG: cobalamin-dependent protein [Candidatus Omnitrophica bacterium]|nr:cobalamin-dependent protein [Candidatus Omnitrophota bacterium]